MKGGCFSSGEAKTAGNIVIFPRASTKHGGKQTASNETVLLDIRPCLKNKTCTNEQIYVNYVYGDETV